MNRAALIRIMETERDIARAERDTYEMGTSDWVYWQGVSQGIFKLYLALVPDEVDRSSIPNPLENEYQWP